MLAVPVARSAGESQDNHVRPESPDHPHHIAQNLIVTPFVERFLRSLGESKIDGTREELLRAVYSPRRQQLLGADYSECVPLLRTDQILATLAASQRKISGAHFS